MSRAASSICSHVVGAAAGGSGLSKRSRFYCIVALLAQRRLGLPGAKSVDEVTQSEQVADSAEIVESLIGIRRPDRLRLVVGPTRRNQRSAAVW
jgi:hypothetical protein